MTRHGVGLLGSKVGAPKTVGRFSFCWGIPQQGLPHFDVPELAHAAALPLRARQRLRLSGVMSRFGFPLHESELAKGACVVLSLMSPLRLLQHQGGTWVLD